MCSPGAFWDWTTLASSIAAPSSPRAARWSRRTARPGWRFTVSAWRRWPFCANTTRYGEIAFKFLQHFMWIACDGRIGEHHDEMWDEQDGFFYDLLRLPDGQAIRLHVRSMVGLLPLCASRCSRPTPMSVSPKADGDDRPVP